MRRNGFHLRHHPYAYARDHHFTNAPDPSHLEHQRSARSRSFLTDSRGGQDVAFSSDFFDDGHLDTHYAASLSRNDPRDHEFAHPNGMVSPGINDSAGRYYPSPSNPPQSQNLPDSFITNPESQQILRRDFRPDYRYNAIQDDYHSSQSSIHYLHCHHHLHLHHHHHLPQSGHARGHQPASSHCPVKDKKASRPPQQVQQKPENIENKEDKNYKDGFIAGCSIQYIIEANAQQRVKITNFPNMQLPAAPNDRKNFRDGFIAGIHKASGNPGSQPKRDMRRHYWFVFRELEENNKAAKASMHETGMPSGLEDKADKSQPSPPNITRPGAIRSDVGQSRMTTSVVSSRAEVTRSDAKRAGTSPCLTIPLKVIQNDAIERRSTRSASCRPDSIRPDARPHKKQFQPFQLAEEPASDYISVDWVALNHLAGEDLAHNEDPIPKISGIKDEDEDLVPLDQ